MQNHLDKNYRNLLVVQNLISWVILYFAILIPIVIGMLAIPVDKQGAGLAIGFVVFIFTFNLGVIALITFLISTWWYKNYTYELTDTVFKKRFGILTKRETGIPYERIQNIDVVSPLLYRIFGLSKLNIQTAGNSSYATGMINAEGILPGMSKQGALDLQQELLRRAHSSNTKAPAARKSAGAGL